MRVWSTLRPINIGTYPKEYGVVNIVNFDQRQMVPEINHMAFGYIDFEQDLPKSEQEHYDLWPERHTNKKLEQAARAMAKALKKSDMSRIAKILDRAYAKGLIESDEELIDEASNYM